MHWHASPFFRFSLKYGVFFLAVCLFVHFCKRNTNEKWNVFIEIWRFPIRPSMQNYARNFRVSLRVPFNNQQATHLNFRMSICFSFYRDDSRILHLKGNNLKFWFVHAVDSCESRNHRCSRARVSHRSSTFVAASSLLRWTRTVAWGQHDFINLSNFGRFTTSSCRNRVADTRMGSSQWQQCACSVHLCRKNDESSM